MHKADSTNVRHPTANDYEMPQCPSTYSGWPGPYTDAAQLVLPQFKLVVGVASIHAQPSYGGLAALRDAPSNSRDAPPLKPHTKLNRSMVPLVTRVVCTNTNISAWQDMDPQARCHGQRG
jgi:hypothetical protein